MKYFTYSRRFDLNFGHFQSYSNKMKTMDKVYFNEIETDLDSSRNVL